MKIYNKRGTCLDVAIRLARPDEASKLIALMTLQHGKSYPDHTAYNEGFLREHIEKDLYQFIVAEQSDGTAIGMVGSKKENAFPGSVVFTSLVVDPRFRGFGLGKRLHRYLLDLHSWETYTCIWGHCVTVDTLTQANHDEFGYATTGILPNRYTFDTKESKFGAYLAVPPPLKHSHLVACLPQGKRDAGLLYAPSSYRGYIAEVYESMQITYRIREPETDTPVMESSLLTIDQNETHRYCEVMVQQTGADFTKILGKLLDRYASLERQTFNVFINLNDPGACFASRVLEEQGFCFTGLQPLAGPYEYMLYHYSPKILIPFDIIKVTPPFEERFAYIRNLYYCRRIPY
jgi:GNAT superfamily N-acetyltransferase